jgi:hypothetical protein
MRLERRLHQNLSPTSTHSLWPPTSLLCFTTSPCSSRFSLKTHFKSIGLCPLGKSTRDHLLFSLIELNSSIMAACHSSLTKASSMVAGSSPIAARSCSVSCGSPTSLLWRSSKQVSHRSKSEQCTFCLLIDLRRVHRLCDMPDHSGRLRRGWCAQLKLTRGHRHATCWCSCRGVCSRCGQRRIWPLHVTVSHARVPGRYVVHPEWFTVTQVFLKPIPSTILLENGIP